MAKAKKTKTVKISREVYDGALEWANGIRVRNGKGKIYELPSGDRGEVNSCPLHNATGLEMDPGNEFLPDSVVKFINQFDTKATIGRNKPIPS
jgi:hypothetical protein